LHKSISIINLPALEIGEKTQDENQVDSSPIYNGSACLPEVFPFNLFATMRAEASFVFQNSPIRHPLATKTPN